MALYSEIRDSLKTGDIVLFSGKGGISAGIKWFTFSQWSHVGMVVKSELGIMLWESTTLTNIADAETGKETKGVQLVALSERLKKYQGEVAVRRLSHDVGATAMVKLAELRNKVRGRPYEKSKLELIKSAYDLVSGHNQEDLSSLFCSELVAEAYQCMGLLGEQKGSNEYTPKDFSEKARLTLLVGDLGPEIPITG